LVLDAHVSGRRIARALRRREQDVRAANEERQLDGATDETQLELAANEDRILMTFNVADFPDIARRWPRPTAPTLDRSLLSVSPTASSARSSAPSTGV
jgi:hypothetical protein